MCKGEPRPSRSYRIVEEIRLVQVSQVQEAGSREQPVGREGFQDGVHRAGFQETPLRAALPSIQGGGDPRTELRLGRASSPGGRSRRAPGEERRGWRGSGALGDLKAAAPNAQWAFSRLLLQLLPGRSWLPWGPRGVGPMLEEPPGPGGNRGWGSSMLPRDSMGAGSLWVSS